MHTAQSGEFLLIARRNNSLSATGRALVLGSLVLLSFAISLAFAFLGAWLVLPFAGAEMAVLFLAFRYMQRHAGDFESIAIKGERVLVERWELGQSEPVRVQPLLGAGGAAAAPVPGGQPCWRCAPTGARWSSGSI